MNAMSGIEHFHEQGVSVVESQRDSAPKPKVARHELPWGTVGTRTQTPTGFWPCPRIPSRAQRRNPVGVGDIFVPPPRVTRSSQPWALLRNPVGIARWDCPVGLPGGNPNGIPAHSPRLARPRAYLGLPRRASPTPTGLRHPVARPTPQPRWGCSPFVPHSQGCSFQIGRAHV